MNLKLSEFQWFIKHCRSTNSSLTKSAHETSPLGTSHSPITWKYARLSLPRSTAGPLCWSMPSVGDSFASQATDGSVQTPPEVPFPSWSNCPWSDSCSNPFLSSCTVSDRILALFLSCLASSPNSCSFHCSDFGPTSCSIPSSNYWPNLTCFFSAQLPDRSIPRNHVLSHIMAAVLHSLLAAAFPNLMTPLSLCCHPVAKPHDCGVPSLLAAALPHVLALHKRRVGMWHRLPVASIHRVVNCQCVVHGSHMRINFTEHAAYIQHASVRTSIRTAGIAYVQSWALNTFCI